MGSRQVELYSGSRLADRPTAVYQNGQSVEIRHVLREWRTPSGPGFDVILIDDRRFRLQYDEMADLWAVQVIAQGATNA